MSANDNADDPALAALRELRQRDVSPARARRLRARCHQELRARGAEHKPAADSARLSPSAVRLLAAAWCVVYLWETLRRAAAAYGF